jgi:hypothetical protein
MYEQDEHEYPWEKKHGHLRCRNNSDRKNTGILVALHVYGRWIRMEYARITRHDLPTTFIQLDHMLVNRKIGQPKNYCPSSILPDLPIILPFTPSYQDFPPYTSHSSSLHAPITHVRAAD